MQAWPKKKHYNLILNQKNGFLELNNQRLINNREDAIQIYYSQLRSIICIFQEYQQISKKTTFLFYIIEGQSKEQQSLYDDLEFSFKIIIQIFINSFMQIQCWLQVYLLILLCTRYKAQQEGLSLRVYCLQIIVKLLGYILNICHEIK
ncbi:unnamed protein product [Paramecium pentaurelia]|uniref:Transmembrane protein n=1 Tax=Paramecium pentaurelia TaxID=43138 RepID=A0A8S1XAZ8_9CILI|nr:unnamed protein product [Paramecium pentaurelia]